jgi:hypothetical protein
MAFFFGILIRCSVLIGLFSVIAIVTADAKDATDDNHALPTSDTVIRPLEYRGALRNPHMGFTNRGFSENNRWATLAHSYVPWNAIEDHEEDDIEKIRTWCNEEWLGVEKRNIKVIPRIYLHWSGDQQYWPRDLHPYDYESDEFLNRAVRLVHRLGVCWNNDPRVAHIELGIVGKWGEHHGPAPSTRAQTVLGQAFVEAFPDKKVLVRHPWSEFRDFPFGLYWDSWAHADEMESQAPGIRRLTTRYQTALIGGEVAYDWGQYKVHPGDSPSETVSNPEHRAFLLNTIREFHCSQLRWVSDYDESSPKAMKGAEEIQRAFGYRFVLHEFKYPRRIDAGRSFELAFRVQNTGSAPFYYKWPVELSLLDPETHLPVWKTTLDDIDIRKWQPGDKWNSTRQAYDQPPPINEYLGRIDLDDRVPKGTYLLSLAILDPAGELPALRLAVQNYLRGGRHPIGWCGISELPEEPELDPNLFADPASDDTLHYRLTKLPETEAKSETTE